MTESDTAQISAYAVVQILRMSSDKDGPEQDREQALWVAFYASVFEDPDAYPNATSKPYDHADVQAEFARTMSRLSWQEAVVLSAKALPELKAKLDELVNAAT